MNKIFAFNCIAANFLHIKALKIHFLCQIKQLKLQVIIFFSCLLQKVSDLKNTSMCSNLQFSLIIWVANKKPNPGKKTS